MSPRIVLSLLAVMLMLAVGQVLFKWSAMAWSQEGTLLSLKVAQRLLPALVLYGFATLAWVWVLQYVDLSRAYPFMALAFIVVPLLSLWFFAERIGWHYAVGALLIFAGVVTTAYAPVDPQRPVASGSGESP